MESSGDIGMNIYESTCKLIQEVEQAINRYKTMRESLREPDFFGEVKPKVDESMQYVNQWEKLTLDFIKENNPKYFHPMQVHNVVEAIEQLIVQSFYYKTSKKRFFNSARSLDYSLKKLKRILEEGESNDE